MQGSFTAAADLFVAPDLDVRHLADGSTILKSKHPLAPLPDHIGRWLQHWAERTPQALFAAERDTGGAWRTLTYGQALATTRAIAAALLARPLSADRPIAILSGNSLNHLLLTQAALWIGIPVAPISAAYSLVSTDHAKLREIIGALTPGLIYVENGAAFEPALAALDLADVEVIAGSTPAPGRRSTALATLLEAEPGRSVDEAHARVGPDTVAKILFTSGSTGRPKGVINTQRMLCMVQEAVAGHWRFPGRRPPVLVDWTPWSHTFGGNFDTGFVLRNGGSLYIDAGKPIPGQFETTLRNLREIAPTFYLNVPRGLAMLADALEADTALCRSFYSRLDAMLYAGAALPKSLWDRFNTLSRRERGAAVPILAGWGLTETAPTVTKVHYPTERSGNIGLPIPGTELKLVPSGDKIEMRVRGPNVTPGYWRDPAATRAAFDAEGWFITGDACRPEDPEDLSRGLLFDGRTAENFKLSSGTWVTVGMLRLAAINAGSPVIEDAVVTGQDRDEIGLLVFLNVEACRQLCGLLPLSELAATPAVRAAVAAALATLNAPGRGSSMRVARALILTEPASIDAGELTDKGYLNQRRVLARREALVERLYADPPAPDIILPASQPTPARTHQELTA